MILFRQARKYIDISLNIFLWAVLLTVHTESFGPVEYVRSE